jgi:diaminohydroxyphosphoribosylaminopyrimidine deaminase / 5-amino-6-(5-phosphoribosylamino)uracil reductase
MRSDDHFMNLAMQMALKAKGKTSPNPLVGAIIVKNGKIIGQGYHHKAGGPHAEILALSQAGKRAKGATLYVTLEPCSHYGRTPPCVDAVLKSGIKEVVVGMKDPNPVNNGKSIKILKNHRIKVKVGILEKELRKLNEPFIKYITQQLPFVTIKVGQSLDGKIATKTYDAKWITGRRTRDFARGLRKFHDAILVGISTVLKDNPSLNSPGKAIKKIIVDSSLRLPLNARIFDKTSPGNIIIAAKASASAGKVHRLRKSGARVLILPGKDKKVDLKSLLKKLATLGLIDILVEGGGEINAALLKENLVDKVSLFIAPKIIGGNRAVNSFGGEGIKSMRQATVLRDIAIKRIGQDIWVEGYVHRHN